MSNANGYGAEVNENDESLVPEIRLPGAVFEPANDDSVDEEVEIPAPDSVPEKVVSKQKKQKKEKKVKKERVVLSKPSVENDDSKVRKVPVGNRSMLLRGLSFAEKREMVLKTLSLKFGVDVPLKEEGNFEAAEVVVSKIPLHVKFQKIEKGNPDRSLKVFVYPSEFRGKKILPVARSYEKRGRIYISRFFDKIDSYLAKKNS